MKTLTQLSLLAVCLTAPLIAEAQVLSDYSNTADWGAPVTIYGSGSGLSISNGAAHFSAGGTEGLTVMRYNGVTGSYTSNWSVWVEVNYAAPSALFDSGVSQFINLGLMAARSDATLGLDENDEPNFNALMMETSLYHNGSGGYSRDMRPVLLSPGSWFDDENRQAAGSVGSSATTSSAVMISFDATSKVLTAGFATAGFGSEDFAPITTLTADTATWGMTDANTFSIYLWGNAGFDGEDEETGPGPTFTGENFASFGVLQGNGLTAIPEPSTYAAMAGALALGLAAWRRRQRATTV